MHNICKYIDCKICKYIDCLICKKYAVKNAENMQFYVQNMEKSIAFITPHFADVAVTWTPRKEKTGALPKRENDIFNVPLLQGKPSVVVSSSYHPSQ